MPVIRKTVLIHGYSDEGYSFEPWARILGSSGRDITSIRIGSYQSLTNELTIKDIAEALDRAIRDESGLDEDEDFDAIVHSTGGLVIRAWLTVYAGRRDRLKNLIMLAPANFGSPMAHKGRSWIGAIFKGNRDWGPDFMEAGDRILAALELGSSFTWDLAHTDLLGTKRFYGNTASSPFVFTFIGKKDYGRLKRLVTEPGTDGTVRWAGCGLNCRRIDVDLTVDQDRPDKKRVSIAPWPNVDMPLVLVNDVNHGTIMSNPTKDLIKMVTSALDVRTKEHFEDWCKANVNVNSEGAQRGWQQFVVRVVDERGDPVPDYHLEFYTRDSGGKAKPIDDFAADVHAYTNDKSFRCFHVNLVDVRPNKLPNLFVRVLASSGTKMIGYHGYGSHRATDELDAYRFGGKWDADIDLTKLLRDEKIKFFFPFTTTLIQITLNREPHPLVGVSDVLKWVTIH